MKNILIYLDNQATTPIDPKVLEMMNPYLTKYFGNPASINHIFGWQAEEAITIARERVSEIINANPNEIVFTSGATESINLALKGLVNNHIKKGDHIITTNIEHKAVIDVLDFISSKGIEVSYVAVKKDGMLDIQNIKNKIKVNTKLCTIIHGNNEIGTIQPIKEIGELCKENNIIFHVDAAQTLGKKKIDVIDMNIDLLSISGHKIYAPKGVGALYIKRRKNKIELEPLIHGGGHEYGYRSGTLSVHNIVGLGVACMLANKQRTEDNKKIKKMRDSLLKGLMKKFPNLILNGNFEKRLEGNLNITFPKYSAERIMMKLTEIACSTGSACTSSIPKPSHVLLAIGLNKEQINNTIRFGIGRFNNMEEINYTIKLFERI
jgi:cysteine desulfurase